MRYRSCLPQELPSVPLPEHSALLPVHPGASDSLLPLPPQEPSFRPQTELPAQLRPWTQGMLHSRHPYRQPAYCLLPCRPASHHFALRSLLHHTAPRFRLRSVQHCMRCHPVRLHTAAAHRYRTCCIRRSLRWRTAPGSCHSPSQPDEHPLSRQSSPLFLPAQSLPPLFSDFPSADSNVRPPPSGFRTVHSKFFSRMRTSSGQRSCAITVSGTSNTSFPSSGKEILADLNRLYSTGLHSFNSSKMLS